MVSYVTRIPAGVVGAVSRSDSLTIEPGQNDTVNPVTAYGTFVKTVSGKMQAVASGDAASVVTGVATRPYPAQSTTNGLGAATPPAGVVIDRLKRGYFHAALAAGTAAKDGQVFVRVTAGSGRAVGAIEAAADGGNCVAVVGAVFTGPADANGITEIAFNI
ncbi:structural cement protein Gp24 [Salinarimonas soli]|uniref:Bacteriophage protein n=1 Tax=Salinarimonas soli TaxID=1638099 RepID=A0A5B2VGC3_9HYPH|nr:hypothetical protein [Salinarimonas soli]KAA2237678.1 hypothetical protein F0L46_08335 [Salinarimonas soli]